MARKIKVTKTTVPDDLKNVWYVNNFSPVGSGRGSNRWLTDVQLVQFFLFRFYEHHPELLKKLPPRGSTFLNGVFAVDGLCGPRTIRGIEVFQDFQRQALVVDGRVSIAKGVGFGHMYTIFGLNKWHQLFSSHAGSLEDDPLIAEMTPELHAELMLSKEPDGVDW